MANNELKNKAKKIFFITWVYSKLNFNLLSK